MKKTMTSGPLYNEGRPYPGLGNFLTSKFENVHPILCVIRADAG